MELKSQCNLYIKLAHYCYNSIEKKGLNGILLSRKYFILT